MKLIKKGVIIRTFFYLSGCLYELYDKVTRGIPVNLPEGLAEKLEEFRGMEKNAKLPNPFYIIETEKRIFSKRDLGRIWEQKERGIANSAAMMLIKRAEGVSQKIRKTFSDKVTVGEISIMYKIKKSGEITSANIDNDIEVLLIDPKDETYEMIMHTSFRNPEI